jgi:hypothetical protein
MTIYTWPNLSRIAPGSLDWGLTSNTHAFGSPLSGSVQTLELPGARWRFSFDMNSLAPDDSATLRAWLVGLRGQSGRFYMHNMSQPSPRGAGGGAPVVSGAGQSGVALSTSGWPFSTTVLKVGDFFEVNGELKMVMANVVSNASGAATVTFEPPLRASPANLAPITTVKPKAIFKLDDDTVRWLTTPSMRGPLGSFPIAATEAW